MRDTHRIGTEVKTMETFQYRGYEITIKVHVLDDGRIMTETETIPTSHQERERIVHPYLVGTKTIHVIPELNAVQKVLKDAKHFIDVTIDSAL
ncbi:MAG TPA: hypothetical protein VHN11_13820 [Xanthobacteraceae bacterium]|jgi:hypothetical protein|nr:hypothetical protein [Xanthobacteraceae bacterium]